MDFEFFFHLLGHGFVNACPSFIFSIQWWHIPSVQFPEKKKPLGIMDPFIHPAGIQHIPESIMYYFFFN